MVNTHKPGYSTSEVAQIIGCSTQQVFNLIDSHRIEAMITEPTKPNGRRTIRFSRENIKDYMRKNPKRFSAEERRIWGVDEEPNEEASKVVPVEKLPNRPTGAWAGLIEGIEAKPQPAAPVIPAAPVTVTAPQPQRPAQYSVLVNGRIAVAGISKETALAITTALLNDTGSAKFDDISLKRIERLGKE